jgi:putative protease
LKDFDASGHLEKLIRAGVTSFKIEGRLKDVAYVKNMTAYFRKALDTVVEQHKGKLKKASLGETVFPFTPDPERTFHRGSTSYFLDGRRKGFVSLHTPKSIGKRVGVVAGVYKNHFIFRGSVPLNNGDGICFYDKKNVLRGTNINRVDGDRVFPRVIKDVYEGAVLYRNFDCAFNRLLAGAAVRRKVAIRLTLAETDTGFCLSAVDGEGISATYCLKSEKVPARNAEQCMEIIKGQLVKTGDTIYRVTDIVADLRASYFFQARFLNALRRGLLSRFDETREKAYAVRRVKIEPNAFPYPDSDIDFRGNVLNEKARAFYERHGVRSLEDALEKQRDFTDKVVMTSRYCIRYELGMCEKREAERHAGIRGEAHEQLYLRHKHRVYRLDFNCKDCEMNVVFIS